MSSKAFGTVSAIVSTWLEVASRPLLPLPDLAPPEDADDGAFGYLYPDALVGCYC